MEYFRDPKNQVYADIAYRLGKIIVQYERINNNEEKFEATLYLAVLQNLMTNCREYIKNMTGSEIFKSDVEFVNWGLKKDCWVKNTFNEELNLGNFITRIRNSVSHPTEIDLESEFPSTGFSTIIGNSGLIERFRFINSPDTIKNRQKYLTSIEEVEQTIYTRDRIKDKIIHNEFPKEISYKEVKLGKEIKYSLTLEGKPFIRISIIELTTKQLGNFVKYLANYLAQPIQKNWDGFTIKDLLVA